MPVDLPREAIVIRFTPKTPEKVLERAERDHRVTGRYELSVFADVQRPGESYEATLARLLAASEISAIDPARNPKYVVCARAGDLYDQGFTFVKDEYAGEVEEHYSVDLGLTPTLEEAKRFVGAFTEERRRDR